MLNVLHFIFILLVLDLAHKIQLKVNLFMFVFLTDSGVSCQTCRPINCMMISAVDHYFYYLFVVLLFIFKGYQTVLSLSIIFIFKTVILSILIWEMLPYVIIGTTRQGVASRAANVIPKDSCKLPVGHCPQEPIKTGLNKLSPIKF